MKERFKYHIPYNYETLINFTASPDLIWELEKELHSEYKKIKYLPKLEFGGKTECFDSLMITSKQLKKIINEKIRGQQK